MCFAFHFKNSKTILTWKNQKCNRFFFTRFLIKKKEKKVFTHTKGVTSPFYCDLNWNVRRKKKQQQQQHRMFQEYQKYCKRKNNFL